MTRTMHDSVTMARIPLSASMVAYYVDGLYANGTACRTRFPHAILVPIAVFASTNDGVVLDCETGDATPAQCPGWVVMRRKAGVDPTVYVNTSTWPWVINAFRSAGVPEPHYWVAAYPGIGAVLYPGSVAHQYADPPGSGGDFDLSVVADYWPGVDPQPHPQPKPTHDVAQTRAIQTAVHVIVDGSWGALTMAACNAVIRRSLADVRYLQARVGATQDGWWGPLSEAARVAAVALIQSAIGVVADGVWGPLSKAAWITVVANNSGK